MVSRRKTSIMSLFLYIVNGIFILTFIRAKRLFIFFLNIGFILKFTVYRTAKQVALMLLTISNCDELIVQYVCVLCVALEIPVDTQ